MPRDPKNLRKSYEIKIGKDRAAKLSDAQIGLLSKFYNQLSKSEQSDLDSKLLQGRDNTLLHEMADEFISEIEDTPSSVATESAETDENILSDLDELLGEIKADESARSSSALATYEGIRQSDLVDKEVDERILRLLGLEEVFDIDYATYLTLLKESMVAARMTNSQIPTEESELLTNEFRTVKSKVGRFKIKKKKVSFDGSGGATAAISPSKFMLPGEASESDETSVDSALLNKLDELLSVVKQDLKLDKNEEKKKKVTAENLRRRGREDKLEDGSSASKFLKGAAKKAFAPFQSILDKILKFLGFTALGFIFDKFYKWWTNPENEKQVELLGTFLKDWWPSLSAAALLFLTPFGGFVRGTIRMLRRQLPRLLRLIARNPLAAGVVVGGGILATQLPRLLSGNDDQSSDLDGYSQGGMIPPFRFRRRGIPASDLDGYSQGGMIPAATQGGMIPPFRFRRRGIPAATQGANITTNSGQEITGAGVDTQLIAAQPGEMIIPVSTVNQYGSNFFMDLIKSSGKTGKPKMVNNIQFAKSGGMVGNIVNNIQSMENGGVVNNIQSMENGGIVGGLVDMLNFLPGTGNVMAPMASQGQYQDKGTVRSKLLGINVPGSLRGQGYSNTDLQRYNRSDTGKPTEFLERFDARIPGLSPVVRSKRRPAPVPNPAQVSEKERNANFIGESFRDFNLNLNLIRDAAQQRRKMLDQVMPGRFDGNTNLHGQPLNMGPQSSIAPVGTPVVSSETKMIVLPPTTTIAKKPDIPVKEGSDIPDFSIIASSAGRGKVTSALGIADLVGA